MAKSEAKTVTFRRPMHQETEARRKLVEQIITTRLITSIEQLHEILETEYDTRININTLGKDLRHVNAQKNTKTGAYEIADRQVTQFDLYLMLRHACVYLLNGMALGPGGDTIFLYPDLGTGQRFAELIEFVREDEVLAGSRARFRDGLLGCVWSGGVVIVFLRDGKAGNKFFHKLRVFASQESDLGWVENSFERDVVEQVLGIE